MPSPRTPGEILERMAKERSEVKSMPSSNSDWANVDVFLKEIRETSKAIRVSLQREGDMAFLPEDFEALLTSVDRMKKERDDVDETLKQYLIDQEKKRREEREEAFLNVRRIRMPKKK
jgi:hypothetical protein